MPKLDAFTGVSQGWINQLSEVAAASVRDSIEEGAQFMRDAILDSPTSHPWHTRKNRANGFGDGARIGNTNPEFGEVDPNSGNMLRSVSTLGPAKSASGSEIVGLFGWIDNEEEYFIKQDTGSYDVGAAMGMGLLNGRSSRGNVLRDYGAKVAAEQKLIEALSAAGLKSTGSTGGMF